MHFQATKALPKRTPRSSAVLEIDPGSRDATPTPDSTPLAQTAPRVPARRILSQPLPGSTAHTTISQPRGPYFQSRAESHPLETPNPFASLDGRFPSQHPSANLLPSHGNPSTGLTGSVGGRVRSLLGAGLLYGPQVPPAGGVSMTTLAGWNHLAALSRGAGGLTRVDESRGGSRGLTRAAQFVNRCIEDRHAGNSMQGLLRKLEYIASSLISPPPLPPVSSMQ